jgi:hypothetical protein
MFRAYRTKHRVLRWELARTALSPYFFRLLPKLDVVGSSPIARSLEVVKSQAVPVPGSERVRRFFCGTHCGTRWGVDFRRQEGLLLRCERGQQRVEIEGRLRPVGLWLRAEPQLTTHLRRLRAELVRLPIPVDLLPRLGVLPSAEAVLDAVVGRRSSPIRRGRRRSAASRTNRGPRRGPPSRSP